MKTHYFVLLYLTPVLGIVLAAGAIVFVVSRVLPDFAPPPLADVSTAEVEMYQWFEDEMTTAQLSKVKPVQAAPTPTNVTPSGRSGKTQHYTLAQTASTSFREPIVDGGRMRQAAQRARPHRARAAKPVANNAAHYNNDPLGDLSIAGRVLDQYGQPVPNIEIVARTFAASMHDERQELQGLSSKDGAYEIAGLLEGEYEIRTTPTELYPSQRMHVAAGFHSADLILTGSQEVRIFGTVNDTRGEPLAGVEVIPGRTALKTLTDENGNYEAYLVVRKDSAYGIHFQLQGYTKEQIQLKGLDLVGTEEMRIDAGLIAEGKTVTVSGTVEGDNGKPIAGQLVQLSSQLLRTHYRGVTDADGKFSIPNVESSPDYRVKVSPKSTYQDYIQSPVDVGEEDLALDIVLVSLETGRVTGRMVNAQGESISDFRFWLQSRQARKSQPLPVVGDHSGYFVLDEAPAGPLMFTTRSAPHMNIIGVTLDPQEQVEVVLVLDWGEYEMGGQVTGDRGEPLPGVQVTLVWSDNSEGLQSRANRRTVTDGNGGFKFTQLGPGHHMLRVQAPGYRAVQESYEVMRHGKEVEVRLEPLRG